MPTYAAGSPTHQEEFRSRAGEQEGGSKGKEMRRGKSALELRAVTQPGLNNILFKWTLNKNIVYTSAKYRL